MELLYLWIGEYRNIKNQEFHFSNEFNIKLDLEKTNISIQPSEKEKSNLFDETFLNINAIIGQNGSGKSNLFSLMKEMFNDDFYDYNNYIIILKDTDGNLLLFYRNFGKNANGKRLRINGEELKEYIDIDDNMKLLLLPDKSTLQNLISLIFHSNSFTIQNDNSFSNKNIIDISLNSEILYFSRESNKQLFKRYFSYKEISKDKNYLEDIQEKLEYSFLPTSFLQTFDILSKVEFVSKYKGKDNLSFIPFELVFSFNQFFFFENIELFENAGLKGKIEDLKNLLFTHSYYNDANYNQFDLPNSIELFKSRVIVFMFLYALKNRMHYSDPNKDDIKKIIDELSNSKDLYDIPKIIKQNILKWELKNESLPHNKIIEIVKNIDNEFDGFSICDRKYENFAFGITEALQVTLKKIFDFWYDKDFIFRFDWLDMSAGQSALLNIFSKIHWVSNRVSNDTVWLLVDEGDLYLHPEWQRTFLSNLHHYLPLFFKDKKVQLFLTSHSPFLVSDLPNENIILLERIENKYGQGFCEVTRTTINNTFGANIYDLYADSFFLKSGFIGEFAKNKIDDLFSFLNNDMNNKYTGDLNDDTALKLIKIIGEPFVKTDLLQLYDKKNKTNTEKDFIDEEIARLNKRKEQLK